MSTSGSGKGLPNGRSAQGRRSVLPLLIACAAYLLSRAAVLWLAFDAVALPTYEVHNMGNGARAFSLGFAGPPPWQYYDNAGGQQLVALLAAPLYALFGDSYLVLKLVPVLLGLGALILLWRLLDREFGRLAAGVAATLFIAGPPTLVKYSMFAWGNHFEHVFFALWLYSAFALVHREGRTRLRLASLGAAAGMSLWVYPGAVVCVLLFAALHLLLRGLRGALADLPVAGGGFLLGLSPLIVTNLLVGGRSLDYVGDSLKFGGGSSILPRLGRNLATMLGDLLPRAGVFESLGPFSAQWAERLYLAAFVGAWLLLLVLLLRGRGRGWERWRTAPLLAYLPLFLLIIGAGTWDFDRYHPPLEVGQFRYFVTHFAFAAMLIGVAVARLADGRPRARAGAWALGACALLPCLDTLPVATPWPGTAGAGLRYEGHHYPYYGLILLAHAERDPVHGGLVPDEPAITRWLSDMPPRHALDAWTGVAHYAGTTRVERRKSKAVTSGELVDLHALLDGRPPAVQLALARGIGSVLRGLVRGTPTEREQLHRLLLRLEREGHPLAHAVIEGLCLEHDYTLSRDVADRIAKSFLAADVIPASLRADYERGLGIQLGRLAVRGIPADQDAVRNVLASLPAGARAEVAFGFGWGYAERGPASGLPAGLQALGQAPLLTDALHGAGACRRHLAGPAPVPAVVTAQDEAGLDAAALAALRAGLHWPAYPARWSMTFDASAAERDPPPPAGR